MRGWGFGIIFLLSSCGSAPDTTAIDAKLATDRLEAQVSSLQARVSDLESKAQDLRRDVDIVSSAHDSLVKTVNHNAEANNKNSARDMTRRGACGTEWVPGPSGWVMANKTCTIKDMSK